MPHDVQLRDAACTSSVDAMPVKPGITKVSSCTVISDGGSSKKLNSPTEPNTIPINPVCFATHDACGVLDLGASKTVIGSEHVKCLIQSLSEEVRARLTRCPCQVTFKFGNQGTLTSSQAIVVPIGSLKLKIAIVQGGTPFLISNTFMRAIRAKIDCSTHRLTRSCAEACNSVGTVRKGVWFLLNLNDVVEAAMTQHVPEVSDTKSVETISISLAARTETSLPAETPESTGQRDTIMMGPEKIRTIQDSSHEAQVHRSSESPFCS